MPRNYRKKNYSRPGYRACGKMVYSDASKALAMVKSVKRLLNVEVKNHDVQLTELNIGQGSGITQLSNIASGDTTNTRDGAQIKMVGYELNYSIAQDASATTATFFRIMLVIDKQTNQAIYTNTVLLEDTTADDIIISPRNLDNMRRFTILYDRVHTLSKGGSNGVHVKKYFKKDLVIRYDASTPSIADLTENSVSLLVCSSEATNTPVFTFFGRLRYVDN